MVYFCLIYYFRFMPRLILKNLWGVHNHMMSVLKNFEHHKCCSLFCRNWSCSRCSLNNCFILINWWHEMEWIFQGRVLSVFTVWSNLTEVRYCLYTELLNSLQTMIYMLYKLTNTYFVSLIKLFCEVDLVVLCSNCC